MVYSALACKNHKTYRNTRITESLLSRMNIQLNYLKSLLKCGRRRVVDNILGHGARGPRFTLSRAVNFFKKLPWCPFKFLMGTRLITTISFFDATSTQNYLNIKHAHDFTQS